MVDVKNLVGVVVVAVGVLGACRTAYQPMGFSGGYRDRRMGPGQFFVEVRVNGYTSSGTALEYLHRRAQELCVGAGFDAYDIADAASGSQVSAYTNYNTGDTTVVQKPEMSAVVRCRNERRPVVASKPAPPPAAPTPPRPTEWFCTIATDAANAGVCRASKAGCEQVRTSMAGKMTLSECFSRDIDVTCYEYEQEGVGGVRSCHPTAATCEANRDAIAQQAGCRLRTACTPD